MIAVLKTIAGVAVASVLLSACAPAPLHHPPAPEYEPVPSPPMPVVDTTPTGSIYNSATVRELFRDIKAYRIGDVLTVMLDESTDAQMTSATNTSKDDTNSLGATTLFGHDMLGSNRLGIQTNNSRSFNGSGNSAQSNSLSGELSVTVHEVLANGNLVIRGEKRTTINQGMEFLRLSGIVRPEDVSDSNEVLSTRIANAHVSYGGRGVVNDSNRAGWASRFFNSGWWPF